MGNTGGSLTCVDTVEPTAPQTASITRSAAAASNGREILGVFHCISAKLDHLTETSNAAILALSKRLDDLESAIKDVHVSQRQLSTDSEAAFGALARQLAIDQKARQLKESRLRAALEASVTDGIPPLQATNSSAEQIAEPAPPVVTATVNGSCKLAIEKPPPVPGGVRRSRDGV